MSVNLIQLEVSDEQVATAVAALDQLETALAGLVSLSPDDRRRLTKMGPKSEVFCRQALSVLEQNRQIVPPSLDLPGAQLDLRTLDRLRPLLDRLQRLAERGEDTETALGADLMAFALEGYGLLKVSGKNQGLDGLRKEMGARWAKGRRAAGVSRRLSRPPRTAVPASRLRAAFLCARGAMRRSLEGDGADARRYRFVADPPGPSRTPRGPSRIPICSSRSPRWGSRIRSSCTRIPRRPSRSRICLTRAPISLKRAAISR